MGHPWIPEASGPQSTARCWAHCTTQLQPQRVRGINPVLGQLQPFPHCQPCLSRLLGGVWESRDGIRARAGSSLVQTPQCSEPSPDVGLGLPLSRSRIWRGERAWFLLSIAFKEAMTNYVSQGKCKSLFLICGALLTDWECAAGSQSPWMRSWWCQQLIRLLVMCP